MSVHDENERTLLLQKPPMWGRDVEAVQRALVVAEFSITVDGIFGVGTDGAVRHFQQRRGLKLGR